METTKATNSFGRLFGHVNHHIDRVLANVKKKLGIGMPNPAIMQLSRALAQAKLSKTIQRFRSPRRMTLTIAAAILGLVWLGQAIFGLMFRQTASTERLMEWIPLSLSVYMIWNFIKAAGQKPIEPFEWTETERELLLGAPLCRDEVIQYRSCSISRAALTKSLIFTFVMIPDLRILPMGFMGIFIGLALIEVIRIITEIVIYGLNRKELVIFRILVFGMLGVVGLRALVLAAMTTSWEPGLQQAASLGFLLNLMAEFANQASTWYGIIVLAPFKWVADVIVCQSLTSVIWAKLVFALATVVGLAAFVPQLDRLFLKRKLNHDRRRFKQLTRVVDGSTSRTITGTALSIASPPYFYGIGGLAWRQIQGAWSFRYSVFVSLLIPSILSCMPSFTGAEGYSLVANTVGALCFYSMVLLPASLKFDFRRDLDRLTVLKSLPISPFWVVAGQLATPICLAVVFQIFTLLLVMVISPYNPVLILGAMLILLPINFFIFSFENVAFLWYPYRMNQEGVQVLMRSILVFTAKSLIFALGFVATFVWVLVAKAICAHDLMAGIWWLNVPVVFSVGMFAMMTTASILAFHCVVKAFKNFDPSADLAGLD